MEYSSTNFDTCWKLLGSFPASWVIYNEDTLLMVCWSVPGCNTLPTVGNLKSINAKTLRWSSIASLELFSETVVHREMFFKTGVFKIFKNFTVKHLCQSLFLINFIRNRVQQSFFSSEICEILWTPFYWTPPVPASVFCKNFVDMRILILILEDRMWLQLIYFLNTVSFWFAKSFFDWWDTFIS